MTEYSANVDRDALLRAEGYRLLAAAFRYPDQTELRALFSEELEVESALKPLAEALIPSVDDQLAGEYNRLFAQSVAVSPHERAYTGGDLGPGLGQLSSLYEAFGLRCGGRDTEVPDHIGVELEFAAFLCLKEALHQEEETPEAQEAVSIVRAARKTFMQEHLGRWVSAFASKLQSAAHHPYYAELAHLLREWVQKDFAVQGWEMPVGGRHLPVVAPDGQTEPLDDEPMTCPSALQEEESVPLSTLLPSG
ncbi:MAG TPA: molecular chaperone TorD family protein [Pseudomonadota bacterium]|nr:molecular chaperone TorD family protein [Pseudomonadota bacterium]